MLHARTNKANHLPIRIRPRFLHCTNIRTIGVSVPAEAVHWAAKAPDHRKRTPFNAQCPGQNQVSLNTRVGLNSRRRDPTEPLKRLRPYTHLDSGDVPGWIHKVDIDINFAELPTAFQALSGHEIQHLCIAVLQVDPAPFMDKRNAGEGIFTLELEHAMVRTRYLGEGNPDVQDEGIGIPSGISVVIPVQRAGNLQVITDRVTVELAGDDADEPPKLSNTRLCAEIKEIEGFCFFDLHNRSCL